jgi:hypothetical protein
VLALFVLITGVMGYFASQLKVDAGFNKQVPLQHEYMRTFTDYMADFGGANRVLIAVVAKDGNMSRNNTCRHWRTSPTTSSTSMPPTMPRCARCSLRTCVSSKWSKTV